LHRRKLDGPVRGKAALAAPGTPSRWSGFHPAGIAPEARLNIGDGLVLSERDQQAAPGSGRACWVPEQVPVTTMKLD
jgi:hypothetical protein